MLTISNIVYDETGVTDVDNDTDNNVANLSNALANQISALGLSSQYYTGPNAVTQYAELTNFVTSDKDVTNYSLASDSSGTAFSKTTGAATGLYVGANEIFLYGTNDTNVVVGRIGSGTNPDSGGSIVMQIALNQTLDGTGHVSGTDLGIAMYAPLVNSNGSAVDDADTLNLSGLINLYSTYSTVTIVDFNDFSKVPSGQDAFALIGPSDNTVGADLLTTGFAGSTEGTVNVSTTGLGANAQTVDNGSSLRIDVVSANSADFAKADTSPEVHDPTNISYESHVEVISAGFELTQNNPTNKLASLTVSAYEGAANNQGSSFVSNVFSDGSTLVQINPNQVHVTDGSGNPISGVSVTPSADGKSVLITGVPALAHIDFTGTSQFDRFIVTNTQTGTTDKTTFDVGGIHVSTITGGHGNESADLGSHTIFEDGGPSFGANGTSIPTVTVDEATLGVAGENHADFSGIFSPSYGPDGMGSLTYALGVSSAGANSGLVDTATGNGIFLYVDSSTGDVVGLVGSSATTPNPSGAEDFRISVDGSGNVTFEQEHAVVHSDPNAADEPATMSSASLVTLTATATDGDGDSASSPAAKIGTAFSILDDEPAPLAPNPGNSLTVGNTTQGGPAEPLPYTASSGFSTYNAGNDGVGSFTIVGPPDTAGNYTWAYNDSSHSSITESYNGNPLFSLTLNPSTGGYSMTMLGTLPDTQLNLDANKIHAGGPTSHTLDVGVMGTSTDDVLITGEPGPINASNGNVGVSNGNLDSGETLEFQLYTDISHNTLIPFLGINVGTKSASSATYHVTGVLDSDHSTVVDLGNYNVGKNGTIHVVNNALLDSITVTDVSGNAIKVGIAGISLLLPPSDAGFAFNAQLTDGDGDHVSAPINVFIDGNNDGVVDYAHVGFPA